MPGALLGLQARPTTAGVHSASKNLIVADANSRPMRPRTLPDTSDSVPASDASASVCYVGAVKSRASIHALIAKFAEDLETAIRAEVRDQLLAAVEGSHGKREAGPAVRASKGATKGAPKSAPKAKAKGAPGSGRRVRRSAEQLGAVQNRITHLRAQGGKLTSEEIQEKLSLSKEDIQRPLQLLRDDGAVNTVGSRRSMQYFVGAAKAGVVKRAKSDASE